VEFWGFYRAVRKRLWMIIFLMIITAGTATVVTLRQPAVWRAETRLRVALTPGVVGDVGRLDGFTAGILFSTIQETVLSRSVLEKVIQDKNLDTTVQDFRRSLGVSRIGGSNLLRITAAAPDAVLSRDIANAVSTAFITYNQDLLDQQTKGGEAFLKEQLDQAQENFDAARREYEEVSKSAAPNSAAAKAALDRLVTTQTTLQRAQDRLESAQLLARFPSLRPASVEVAEPAVTPDQREARQVPQIAAIAALVSLGLGIAVALALEYLDLSVRSPQPIAQQLGLAVLGVIPHYRGRVSALDNILIEMQLPLISRFLAWRRRLSERRRPKPDELPPKAFEAFNALPVNILSDAADKATRGLPVALLVASTRPRDGKTTVVANTGTALARLGYRVLIIDGDLRQPMLHAHFGYRPDARGLTDVLAGRAAVSEVVVTTAYKNLYVMPSGTPHDNPPELLWEETTQALFEQMKAHFDVVICDSPPVSVFVDAQILASYLDRVLLVVDSTRLLQEREARTLDLFQKVGVEVQGVVVNKIDDDYYQPMTGTGKMSPIDFRRRARPKAAAARPPEPPPAAAST
jgi:capsular exopolysaccharide synthesis family protein